MADLRKAARGRECQVRIPGVCKGNPETSGGDTGDSGNDNNDPQPGIVTKQTAVQQTYPLNDRLD